MSTTLWLAYLATAMVVAISPGPGAVLSMSTGARHGYLAALGAIAGLQTALVLQFLVVAAGLGALLATSATAFAALKLAGASYLVWLGIRRWRETPSPIDDALTNSRRALFTQGVLVNLTNPKAIVFIAALVPQFIDPHAPQAPQFLLLTITMVGVDLVVMSAYALLAARCRPLLRHPGALRLQNRLFGALFIGAGAWLAGHAR